jgi:glycosyltransferase 2 family protein
MHGMHGVVRALAAFAQHLGAVAWLPVLYALACHFAKMLARSRAWRNVLAAAFPDAEVRWRSVFGAYAAGAGLNAIVPARGGDLLRLSLIKRRVPDATFTTLASSLVVESIADSVISASLLLWALHEHVLPGVQVLNRLPSVDWFWLFRHPRAAAITLLATLVVGFALGLLAAARIATFRRRLSQGVAILHTPRRYLFGVVSWQLVDWGLRLATIYFFLRAFHIPAPFTNELRVQVTQSLSTIVPLTPAGIGTEQALIVFVLSGQASASALLSLSVGMKTIVSTFNIVLGLTTTALILRTLRWRKATVPAPDGREPEPAPEPESGS